MKSFKQYLPESFMKKITKRQKPLTESITSVTKKAANPELDSIKRLAGLNESILLELDYGLGDSSSPISGEEAVQKPDPKSFGKKTKKVKKVVKEDVDPYDVDLLTAKLKAGEISYSEFRDELDKLDHTNSSMRQGELGEPDARETRDWDSEKADWDTEDEFPLGESSLKETWDIDWSSLMSHFLPNRKSEMPASLDNYALMNRPDNKKHLPDLHYVLNVWYKYRDDALADGKSTEEAEKYAYAKIREKGMVEAKLIKEFPLGESSLKETWDIDWSSLMSHFLPNRKSEMPASLDNYALMNRPDNKKHLPDLHYVLNVWYKYRDDALADGKSTEEAEKYAYAKIREKGMVEAKLIKELPLGESESDEPSKYDRMLEINRLKGQMRDEMLKQNNKSSVDRSYSAHDKLHARLRDLENPNRESDRRLGAAFGIGEPKSKLSPFEQEIALLKRLSGRS